MCLLLQIMNIAELERLEVGIGRGLKLLHILAKKLDMPEWRGAGFRNFFLHQYPEHFTDAQNPHLCAVMEGVKERAFALVRERLDA